MAHHDLKIHEQPFNDLLSGAKTADVRVNDRGFQVGDTVELHEIADTFTGRVMRRQITHIQTGYGLPDSLCVLSYATNPAPASVGGVEVVEVVAYIWTHQNGLVMPSLRHKAPFWPNKGGYTSEPLMTVAQHNRMMLALVARCYQEGAFKTCLECGYQDGHDQICQYHESKRAAASDDLTNVRCLCCQSEHAHNSYDAGFIAGSGMCQACDAAMPAKDLPAVSAEPVEWQHQAPDGSWWGIAKSRVDEARLAGRPIRPLYTHPAGQSAEPDAELVRQCIAQELATWEGDFKGPVHTAMRCLQVRIDAKMATLK